MVQLRWGSVSITGNFRENNEDKCLEDPQGRWFIVADGMGGQAAGEKASEIATEMVSQKIAQTIDFDANESRDKVVSAIDAAVEAANLEIMALGEIEPDYHKMGTTLAFIVNVAGKFYVGGVGDSPVFQLRGNNFDKQTTDHSLTQALLDAGTITPEEAETHRYRNVLYRYLGTKEGSTGTEPREIVPEPGDRYVLCSDGVTDGLERDALCELVKKYDNPQQAAEAIVAAAEQGGSRDNITCMVVHIDD